MTLCRGMDRSDLGSEEVWRPDGDPLFEGMKEFKISGLDLSHLYVSLLPDRTNHC